MLFVFRHGQSLFNVEKDREKGVILNDDNTVLTKEGVLHTLRIAEELKKTDIRPSKIITSSLARARQTGYLLASTLETGCPLEEIEDFGEIRWIKDKEPYIRVEDLEGMCLNRIEQDINCVPIPGTESQVDVYNRVTPHLPNIIVEALDKPIYIVAHYFVIRAIRAYIEHGDVHKMVCYDPPNVDPVVYTPSALEKAIEKRSMSRNKLRA